MKFIWVVVVVAAAALCAAAAYAAGYDDLAIGMSAYNRGDDDVAIASFTKALTDTELKPNLQFQAYLGRARAYMRRGNCAGALADATEALARPHDAAALVLRANAYACTGKIAEAEKDWDAALEAAPDAELFFIRGRMHWTRGQFSDAATDFGQALNLRPQWPYSALWLAISEMRGHHFDAKAFEGTISGFSMDDWPAPILALYVGRRTAEDIYGAAARGDSPEITGRKCEADFYIGEWQLAQDDIASARRLWKSAADNCPHDFIELPAAQLELKRAP